MSVFTRLPVASCRRKRGARSAVARLTTLFATAGLVAQVVACGDCSFEAERIRRFVNDPAHRQCVTEADCTLRSVPSCLELAEASCGQISLSLKSAESAEWQEIETDANDCESGSCPVCNALRVTACREGQCM